MRSNKSRVVRVDLSAYSVALALVLLLTLTGFATGVHSKTVSMQVLGTVSGTLDGKAREWKTISGNVDGMDIVSANWESDKFEMPESDDFAVQMKEVLGDQLGEEERRQLEQMGVMLEGMNPMAEMFGQITDSMGKEPIALNITGHDPSSPNIVTEQILTIHVSIDIGDGPAALLGNAMPAEIAYYVEHSGGLIPDVFYVSDEDDSVATVTFDALEITPDGGKAVGRFQASLCRIDGKQLMKGADLSDCMRAEGSFDTALAAS